MTAELLELYPEPMPAAPPEADVIRIARMATGMTIASAAAATHAHEGRGVSAVYWGNVERGHGGRRGEQVPSRASDPALASMACAVGVAPWQLTEAGRDDAAAVLTEMLRRADRCTCGRT